MKLCKFSSFSAGYWLPAMVISVVSLIWPAYSSDNSQR